VKATHRWVREYCPHDLSPEEAAERLTLTGIEVEDLTPRGDDAILQMEITANRADLQSVIGIARELSALSGVPLRLPGAAFEESGTPASERVTIRVEAPDLCPRYTARLITGVRVGPSPAWLVERIESIGLRPVNNVVDITNFVLFESGQPLHAFDFDKLSGGRIVVRRAAEGERLVTLDGRECALDPAMLVIADAERPVALAGIMGGLETEISAGTTTLLLESAQFENTQVRRTSRRLGLATDSSYRFERGVDPVGVEWASRRAAALIVQCAGGQVAPGVVDIWQNPFAPVEISLRIQRLHRLLGVEIVSERAAEILEALGFGVRQAKEPGVLAVSVPPFRGDVTREVDLVEEVARIYGYDNIPSRAAQPIRVSLRSQADRVADELRAVLPGLGFFEILSSAFHRREHAGLVSPWTDAAPLGFNNPVRAEENLLRVSLMPGLLEAERLNAARGNPAANFFEIGHVFLPREGQRLPEEKSCLALLHGDGFPAMKGVVETVLELCGIATGIEVRPFDRDFFAPGRSAEVRLAGRRLAVLGERRAQPEAPADGGTGVALAEMDLDALVERARLERVFEPLPVFPASTRDLAVVVDAAVPWSRIEQCVRPAAGPHLEDVRPFDVYRGKQIPHGKKSVALSLVFRCAERTLTGEEVDAACAAVVNALERDLGAVLRAR